MCSRTASWVVTLVVLTLSPVAIGDAYADVSCEPLRRLLVLADTQFKRLRGYFDPRLQSWVATYRMPGASLCTIQDTENATYYSCEWVHDPSASSVSENYAGLVRLVTRCLDVRGSNQHEPTPDSQVIRFGIADSRKTVVVGKSESSADGYFVTLDIVPIGLKDFPAE